MVKILVLSDTHLHRPEDIPTEILTAVKSVDLIVHAGDFTHIDVLRYFTDRCEVIAVRGNMDELSVCSLVPAKRMVEVEGIRIGVTHSSGSPKQAVSVAKATFRDVDIIIFGHSHQPLLEKWGNVTLFNPGSPTDHRFAIYPTYGWIEVNNSMFKARIISLNK